MSSFLSTVFVTYRKKYLLFSNVKKKVLLYTAFLDEQTKKGMKIGKKKKKKLEMDYNFVRKKNHWFRKVLRLQLNRCQTTGGFFFFCNLSPADNDQLKFSQCSWKILSHGRKYVKLKIQILGFCYMLGIHQRSKVWGRLEMSLFLLVNSSLPTHQNCIPPCFWQGMQYGTCENV